MTRLTAEHFVLDLTDRPRVGFRGAASADHLRARGFELPGSPNQALRQADGSLVARLSQAEYFLLGSAADDGQRLADEEARWELDHQPNYLLPRHDSHAWLQLHGPRISEVMAKLCGVDLRAQAFPPGQVAQTQVARLSAIVINTGSASAPCFELLFDRCSHAYFLGVVLDALGEFGGVLAPLA
ncbi:MULTISPECIES: sarcosine oxidase [unclassified Pseudomonas]|uniref:sarcosine oxidase n=1 Tax=unclassified Pseudomonas TaxID=196821 RepID=UPI000BDDABC1|nr:MULTISPECIES: sarcosine oxidase [unclassified Pseudomonas]PVZ20649.1 N-methylglutamate dehydrogenase subunit D [Pseudomonas sp. URIL14HWK12:I12]PVZ27715.1 N-methylglutamate dehydrogenase subunit D [Pseudomonas sp. URIL14HWK12:I10]PVZ38604.1 N-methylglutamate dehydrogenase subunit D [Pseudomonas sp. URIL14HWK12:I11]SNZ02696.1 N-methylglutamate dehydrogenase subunit D [Pseudomonas sp. URIL14HWK12:I9]